MSGLKKMGLGYMLSPTAVSNLFTMGCTAKVDPRQELPAKPYTMPEADTRILRARLILEEALETIRDGLGIDVQLKNAVDFGTSLCMKELVFSATLTPDMEQLIDGCCDLHYVEVGTLVACGVPDVPHMALVNYANDNKFPNGVAIADANGKFQKPPGWKAPDHLGTTVRSVNMKQISDDLVASANKPAKPEQVDPMFDEKSKQHQSPQ